MFSLRKTIDLPLISYCRNFQNKHLPFAALDSLIIQFPKRLKFNFFSTNSGCHEISKLKPNSASFSHLLRPPVFSRLSINNLYCLNFNISIRLKNDSSVTEEIKFSSSVNDKLQQIVSEIKQQTPDSNNNNKMGKLFGEDELVLKVRGLPWSTTVDEIINFFEGVNIKNGRAGVRITTIKGGRPSGEAFIEVESEDDVENALRKDKEHMGHRYIEVFKAKRTEMDWVVRNNGTVTGNDLDQGCVRLRGLPFESSKDDIYNFFSGLGIVPNGITIAEDHSGRSTGEAYVQFIDKESAEKALLKHKEKIGHRYIEIFRSTLEEIRSVTSNSNEFGGGGKMRPLMGQGYGRPTPYDRGDRFGGGQGPMRGQRGNSNFRNGFQDDNRYDELFGGYGGSGNGRGIYNPGPPGSYYVVHMRGLPFRASEADIADFFRPVVPVNIIIQYENSGRPSGEADVEFSCREDAMDAMEKDKSHMEHRYIELFLSSPNRNGGGGSGGMGNGNGGGYGGPGPMGSGHSRFGSDRLGGDRFGSDRFGGESLFDRRSSRFGIRPFRSNSLFDY